MRAILFIVLMMITSAIQAQHKDNIKAEIDSLSLMRLFYDSLQTDAKLKSKLIDDRIAVLYETLGNIAKSEGGLKMRIESKTQLWHEPNVLSASKVELPIGAEVYIIGKHNDYFYNAIYEGTSGYVLKRRLEGVEDYDQMLAAEERQRNEQEEKIKAQDRTDRQHRMENEKAEAERERMERFLQPYNENGSGISLFRFEITEVNSAGGVEVLFRFGHLLRDKTIKYVTITASVYNAVGDKVIDRISGDNYFKMRLTGPIDFTGVWETYTSTEPVFYNYNAKCLQLTNLRIDYTDGTNYTYIRELPKTYADDFTNACQ